MEKKEGRKKTEREREGGRERERKHEQANTIIPRKVWGLGHITLLQPTGCLHIKFVQKFKK